MHMQVFMASNMQVFMATNMQVFMVTSLHYIHSTFTACKIINSVPILHFVNCMIKEDCNIIAATLWQFSDMINQCNNI